MFLRNAWFGSVPVLVLAAGCGFFKLDPPTGEDDDDGSGATGGSNASGSGGTPPATSGSGGMVGGAGSNASGGSAGTASGASGAGGSTGGSSGAAAGGSGATGGDGSGATGGAAGAGGDATGGTGGDGAGGTGGGAGNGGSGGSGKNTMPETCEEVSAQAHAGHCYRVFMTGTSFPEARDACEELGAHLVTISSDGVGQTEFDAENAFVWGLVNNMEVWLGLTDGHTDMEGGDATPSTWITGEGIAIDNWSDGEPNNYQKDCPDGGPTGGCYEHCGFIPSDRDGQWNDEVCGYDKPYVCEWDSGG